MTAVVVAAVIFGALVVGWSVSWRVASITLGDEQ